MHIRPIIIFLLTTFRSISTDSNFTTSLTEFEDPPESGQLLHEDAVDDEFLTTVLDAGAQNETIEAHSKIEDGVDDLKSASYIHYLLVKRI